MSFIPEKILLAQYGLEETATKAFDKLPEGNIAVFAANAVNVLLGLLGVFFIVLIIIGGSQWMSASGNEEQIKKAQGLIKNAVIGLIIVTAAYALAYFILQQVLHIGLKTD